MKAVDPWYTTKKWKDIRLKVIKRDKWRCQECGCLCLGKSKGQPSPHCDHIIERKKRPDLAYSMDNLRCVCGSCHSKKTRAVENSEGKPYIDEYGYPILESG